ncbi:MAG TPA: relaxase/mobilization nuclease domain-containing protein [Chloroflexi bacterium]|nr:relaxase/mobilization nuclease domain-containing protein [Chloroflexota bacterium]
MAITKIHPIKSTLKKALTYVLEDNKTREGLLVSSFACSPETADLEFGFTLSHCMEKGNNLAFHLMQSFKPGETDAKTAHQIGDELAIELLKWKYEYVLSTHVDKGHIHNHLIFCAANFEDYRKFVSNRKSYYQIRYISDRLCEQYGLSVVIPGEERGKSYKEYLAHKAGSSWKANLRLAVNQAVRSSRSFEEFLIRMHLAGYEIRQGKYLAFRAEGQQRYTNSKALGIGFTQERITEKINRNTDKHIILRPERDLQLLIDIDNSIKAMQNPRYAQALKVQNLKRAGRTLNYLTELGIDSYSKLDKRHSEIRDAFDQTKAEIKNLENKIAELSTIVKQLSVLSKASSMGAQRDASKINYQILADTASRSLSEKGINPPYPSTEMLLNEVKNMEVEKETLYQSYNQLKRDWRQSETMRKNIEQLIRPGESLSLEKEEGHFS